MPPKRCLTQPRDTVKVSISIRCDDFGSELAGVAYSRKAEVGQSPIGSASYVDHATFTIPRNSTQDQMAKRHIPRIWGFAL